MRPKTQNRRRAWPQVRARALTGRPMTVVRFAAALTMIGNLAASGSLCLDRLKNSF